MHALWYISNDDDVRYVSLHNTPIRSPQPSTVSPAPQKSLIPPTDPLHICALIIRTAPIVIFDVEETARRGERGRGYARKGGGKTA
jgi:hypothetical protein